MKRNNYELLTGGTKSIPLNALPEEAWSVVRGSGDDSKGNQAAIKKYYGTIAILNRCIAIRAGAMSALPWSVSRGEEPFYTAGEGPLPTELLWMRKFKRQLYLYEASLLLYARAYALIEGFLPPPQIDQNVAASAIKILQSQGQSTDISLRWLLSTSITPQWDVEEGLIGFSRAVSRDDVRQLPVDRVCFFDMPNPNSETAAADSPVAAGLVTAKILDSINQFSLKFIDRGAIKATILRVDQTTPPKERQRLRDWWREFMSGIGRAWTSEVLSNAVEPVVIGEGLADVLNPPITRAQAEDLATALGIPHALLFSNSANYATAQIDERNLYTYAIMPDAELIEEELNTKLFERLGYKFSFTPAALRAFQENEKERADTFKIYVDAGIPHGISAQIAGLELPDGMQPDEFDAKIMEQKQANMEMAQQNAAAMASASGIAQSKQDGKQGPPDAQGGTQPKDKQKPTSAVQKGPPQAQKPAAQKDIDIEAGRFRRWLENRIGPSAMQQSWTFADFSSPSLSMAQKAVIFAECFLPDGSDELDGPVLDELFDHDHDDGAKALILQSDPGDDEAEQNDITRIENKMVGRLANALDAQKQAVFDGNEQNMDASNEGVDMGKLTASVARVEAMSGPRGSARDALRAALIEGVDLGVKAANKQFDSVGFGFNWTLANEEARKWADAYSGELISGIDATTLRNLRQSISQWIQNGEPLSALSRELESVFGRQRARLIASTEVTRSYATANQISYRQSGIVKKIQWRTAVGERVCPICGGLHNKIAPLDEGFSGVVSGGIPPAHPRCRCWIVPVVDPNSIGVLHDGVGDAATSSAQQ